MKVYFVRFIEVDFLFCNVTISTLYTIKIINEKSEYFLINLRIQYSRYLLDKYIFIVRRLFVGQRLHWISFL